jgi:hypothetical protein
VVDHALRIGAVVVRVVAGSVATGERAVVRERGVAARVAAVDGPHEQRRAHDERQAQRQAGCGARHGPQNHLMPSLGSREWWRAAPRTSAL